MPQRKPNSNDNNDLDKLLGGRDSAGRFLKRTAQISQMTQVIQKLSNEQAKAQAIIGKASKSAMAGLKRENVLLKSKGKLQATISKTAREQIKVITKAAKAREKQLRRETGLVKKNLRIESKLHRTRERLNRQSRGRQRGGGIRGGGGGIGIGRIGIGLAGIGITALAIQQIKNITDRRLETFLNLGRGSTGRIGALGGRGIASSTKFAALNDFLSGSTSQFVQGRSPGVQAGLLRAQDDLSGLGADVANRLLKEISSSFGIDVQGRRRFFETTGREGISTALEQFRSQQNFPQFTRAINALEQPNDPTLQIRGEFAKTIEALKDTFEKLVVTVGKDLIPIIEKLVPKLVSLLGSLANLTTGDLVKGAAVGAVALIGGRAAAGAAIRSGGLLAAAGLTRGIPAVARGALAAGKAGISGATALPGIAASGGIAASALLAAPLVIGGTVAINASEKTNKALERALRAQGRASQGVGSLDQLAKRLKANATTERERLVAERLRLDSILSASPSEIQRQTQGGKRRDIQKQIDLIDQQKRAIEKNVVATKSETKAVNNAAKETNNFAEKLKKAPSDIASRIDRRAELQLPKQLSESISGIRREELTTARLSAFGGKLALDELKSLNNSLRKQEENLRAILGTFDDDPRSQIEANQVRTQIAGIQRELKANAIIAAQAPITIEQSRTEQKRLEFSLKRLSPLGTIGAFPELQAISDSLRDEIKILTRMANSQELSVLEQINVKKAILSRRFEIRQNQKAFLDAFRDAAVAQVLGSGAGGRSIIISRDQNVGIGLRKGLFNGIPKDVQRALLGNVDPSIIPRMPKTALEILGESNPFQPIDRFNQPPRRRLNKPTPGSTGADSLVSAGRYLMAIGGQLKSEQTETDNESIGFPAGRLFNVQPM